MPINSMMIHSYRSFAAIIIGFAFLSIPASADEFFSIILDANPALAEKILDRFVRHDTAEGIETMREMGKAPDPSIGTIVKILSANYPASDKYNAELLLRVLIDAVFDSSLDIEVLTSRLSNNEEGVRYLLERLDRIGDPLLKGDVIRLIPLFQGNEFEHLLLREGFRITEGIEQRGIIETQSIDDELSAILYVLEYVGGPDTFWFCNAVREASGNRQIREQARNLSRTLFKGP